MKRTTTILLAVTLILSMVSIAAIAQPFSGNGARGGDRGFQGAPMIRGLMNLDLTDNQRNQIQALMAEQRESIRAEAEAVRAEMQSIREEMKALMEADVYDEAAAAQLLARKSEILNARQIEREKIHHYILNEILTDEQRETLAEQRANAEAFGRGTRQDRMAGPAGRRF